MVIVKREAEKPLRLVRFRGVVEDAIIDCEEGLFAALLEFAFHHIVNDAEFYENAAAYSVPGERKTIFLQMAYRKRDVINKLQMYRSEFFLGRSSERHAIKQTLSKNDLRKTDKRPDTMNESMDFAFQKENRTLALYKKLNETMHHSATKTLFDYLIKTQQDCILFLTTQYTLQTSILPERSILYTRRMTDDESKKTGSSIFHHQP
jgi:rubrerythrin